MASTYVDDPRDRAFERLYERYVRDVYRYVLAVLRNPSEAEDVTQTTFLNAYRAIQAGEEPQKPHNWLIAIAHNACRTRVRFAMRRPKEVPIDDLVEQLAVPESERPNVRELLRALGRLPFNQRAALTMRELEGRSYVEIAETLGVTVPAAEALIARARRTLRSQAATLRGLTVLGLPRSLRRLFETSQAGSGGVGSTALAKAAAVLVAGVVAGGAGYTVATEAHEHGPGSTPLQRQANILVAERPAHHAAPKAAARTTSRVTHHAAAAKTTAAAPSHGTPPRLPAEETAAPADAPSSATASAAQPAPSQTAAAPAQPVHQAVTQTVASAVPTVVQAVSQPPSLPIPPVTVPTVSVPAPPQLPPPPPAPGLPSVP